MHLTFTSALQQPTELRMRRSLDQLLVYPENKTVKFEASVLLLHYMHHVLILLLSTRSVLLKSAIRSAKAG